MKRVLVAAAAALFGVAACTSSGSPAASPDAGDDTDAGRTFGGARPVTVRVPAGYDGSKPAPLVMMLHGFSASNVVNELYFPMGSIADEHGFFYVSPNGTFDPDDHRFWNATDACCDKYHSGVDDVAYLSSLVAEIRAAYNIDPKRIYVMGHSNGGWMSHRLACDRADVFAAIASFAGATWSDPTKCNPTAPVGILQVHGTADMDALYAGDIPASDGGDDAGAPPPGTYPGAVQTVAIWAAKNGCDPALVDSGQRLHVNADAQGDETVVSRHAGCPANGAAELWAVQDAPHVFAWTHEGLEAVWSFFEAHAKP